MTGLGLVNVIPSESIPIIDTVSFSVPSLEIAILNVSAVSTSSLIASGMTIERPHDSSTEIVNMYSSEILES